MQLQAFDTMFLGIPWKRNDMLHEKVPSLGHRRELLEGHKEYGLITVRRWKSCDEVHGNVGPGNAVGWTEDGGAWWEDIPQAQMEQAATNLLPLLERVDHQNRCRSSRVQATLEWHTRCKKWAHCRTSKLAASRMNRGTPHGSPADC